jgi:hypothetical protein
MQAMQGLQLGGASCGLPARDPQIQAASAESAGCLVQGAEVACLLSLINAAIGRASYP